jgi:predicted lipoprotein with Yx(FWY)xxD motif
MKATIPRRSAFIAALVCGLGLAAVALAASRTTSVGTHTSKQGKVLANSRGFSLYMFAKDTPGAKGKSAKSTCYGQCAKVWPPLLVSAGGRAVAARGSGVNQRLLATARRKDGKLEVTYDGWPLYTYAPDTKAGQTNGEAANQFGARWYVLNTKGQTLNKSGGVVCVTVCQSY